MNKKNNAISNLIKIHGFVFLVIVTLAAKTIFAESRIDFNKSLPIKIQSLPDKIEAKSTTVEYGEKENTIKVSVSDCNLEVVDKKICYLCAKSIKLAPNLKLPLYLDMSLDPIMSNLKNISGNVTFKKINVPGNMSEYIQSGPDGAILEKNDNGFQLIEGQAYLLNNNTTSNTK